ncbi:hypothetical protein HCJ76_00440 [Streptomyces sp. MC1]|uniref:hypothetical protein n=1 Tax=Streptomyces sp. MC1 TaxID=295105 RepID=UPI0018C9A171|nr:hypothetical protein [Streptomyces sp. MC1]MBG7696607.1 hypothetical protein [Streptomyces sp. MC1]
MLLGTGHGGCQLPCPPAYEQSAHNASLFAALLATGIEARHDKRAGPSTDKLRALLAIVQDDKADRTDEEVRTP